MFHLSSCDWPEHSLLPAVSSYWLDTPSAKSQPHSTAAAAASDCCQTERSTALLDVESDEMLQAKVITENPPVTVTTRDLM